MLTFYNTYEDKEKKITLFLPLKRAIFSQLLHNSTITLIIFSMFFGCSLAIIHSWSFYFHFTYTFILILDINRDSNFCNFTFRHLFVNISLIFPAFRIHSLVLVFNFWTLGWLLRHWISEAGIPLKNKIPVFSCLHQSELWLMRSTYHSIYKCHFSMFALFGIPDFLLKLRNFTTYLGFLSVQPLSYLAGFRIFCTLILLSVSKVKMMNY